MPSPWIEEARLDHLVDADPFARQRVAQGEPLGRGIAEREALLHGRPETAVGEISARLGADRLIADWPRTRPRPSPARRAGSPVFSPVRPRRPSVAASERPPSTASRSTASGKLRPSVSLTKAKMSPCLPEEKSWKKPFWSLTKNDGVFSALKGERPAHSRPCLRSSTRRPTTSDTGSRARISSRNSVGNFMGTRLAARGRLASRQASCPLHCTRAILEVVNAARRPSACAPRRRSSADQTPPPARTGSRSGRVRPRRILFQLLRQ